MTGELPLDGLRVLAHPLRMRILSLLTGVAMSAAEAARELDQTQANISYHFRRLHDAGLLDVVEEVEIRGGRAKRYRHDPGSGRRMGPTGPDDARLLAATLSEELQRRSADRLMGTKGLVTDAELWVDQATWDEAVEHARQLSRLLHTAAQPPRTEGTVHVSATVSLFKMR